MKRLTRFSAIVVIFLVVLASCGVAVSTIYAISSSSDYSKRGYQLDNTEPAMTPMQEEAVKSAREYLDGNGFSKQYLTDWLTSYEKFSPADVEFALEYLKPDWNKQAVLTAQTYLTGSGMSREGLIEQMSNPNGDKYTKAQARYAADHVLPR